MRDWEDQAPPTRLERAEAGALAALMFFDLAAALVQLIREGIALL